MIMAARKKTSTTSEDLTEAVRVCPSLYDRSDPRFKDQHLKRSLWRAIGLQLGIKSAEAEKKWKNLKDRYIKEIKRMDSSSENGAGTTEVHTTNWTLFEVLDGFLRNFLRPNCTISYLTVQQTPMSGGEEEDDACQSLCDTRTVTVEETPPESSPQSVAASNPSGGLSTRSLPCATALSRRTRKRKSYDDDDVSAYAVGTFNPAATKHSQTTSGVSQPEKKDSIDLFCDRLRLRLRALKRKDQVSVQREIDNMLYNLEASDEYVNAE